MSAIVFDNVDVSYYVRSAKVSGRTNEQLVGGSMVQRRGFLQIRALREITAEIRQGERIGLIGTNGSGKSTFLKTCSRGLIPEAGSLTINGQVSAQLALGASIKAPLTGRQNVELKCLYLGISLRRIKERVAEAKEISGLGDYFELPVQTYSTGMRTRLAMSFMTLLTGEIVIMDEWIGAADSTVNDAANYLRSRILNSASTLIIASHSSAVLRQWTERVIWLHKGRIEDDGPLDEVMARYHRFIREQTNQA